MSVVRSSLLKALIVGSALAMGHAGTASAKDCGNEPTCGGGPIVHTCNCGDFVKWDYTLPGDLENSDGSFPCDTDIGLTIGAGVVFDGGGYEVRGPGSGFGTTSYAIFVDGVASATIRNVTVSDFRQGVRLDGAGCTPNVDGSCPDASVCAGVTVSNVTASDIGDFSSQGSCACWGIAVQNSSCNLIENSLIEDSADEGIHMGGSDSNTIDGNTINDCYLEQLYMLNSDDNTISDNVTTGGTVSARIETSDGNTFTGNTFNDKRVEFVNGANDNIFGTATVGNTISGAQLKFVNSNTDGNVATGGSITNTGPCLRVENSAVNTVDDVTLSCGSPAIIATGDCLISGSSCNSNSDCVEIRCVSGVCQGTALSCNVTADCACVGGTCLADSSISCTVAQDCNQCVPDIPGGTANDFCGTSLPSMSPAAPAPASFVLNGPTCP